jgi:hypothetical protein
MSELIKCCTDRIRVKTNFYLVNGNYVFVDKSKYPFNLNKIPIMCKFTQDENLEKYQGYESGNRSILYYYNGICIKAKGIGIPRGISQPIFDNGEIFTYHLSNDLEMCHRSVIWGFMRKEDVDCELFGSKNSNVIGLSYETIGYGLYSNVKIISFKDRKELFKYLRTVENDVIYDKFDKSGRKVEAFCYFSEISSDLRVQELLYVFMFPYLDELLGIEDCIEYIRWLGSSCGFNLRKLHDCDILHGTWIGDKKVSIGLTDVHSNSYIGNHVVEEGNTKLVDFDLSQRSSDEKMKKLEKWCLINMENPLFYAGSYLGNEPISMNIAMKNIFREKLSMEFKEAIDDGYNYNIYNIEKKLKRSMLDKITKVKQCLWDLYKLPKDFIGNIYFLEHLIATKKIDKKEVIEYINL